MTHIAVIDIGKTNAKLALVHPETLDEVAVVTRPNTVVDAPPWPHFDVDGHWGFLLDNLSAFHSSHGIDVITVTTHGACAALIGEDGSLAAPILDYEHDGPNETARAYDNLRPSFAETGSPRLPRGLNLGAQLYWQFASDPTLLLRTKSIVTYPQYWGYRLTGQLACDPSSLGCHTDLWNPHTSSPSSLVEALGIMGKTAPALRSDKILGPILPEIARRTGLSRKTPVLCGIHDSNASLLPHILSQSPPFSVVSTGTWVIVLTVGGAKVTIDPANDMLINVNAFGQPVPSARFMGGREYEMVLNEQPVPADEGTMSQVAQTGPMLMPAIVSDSGPFQGRTHSWIGEEPAQSTPERSVAVSYYLALTTAQCLLLTGHAGPIIVEGPFASNTAYCTMLAQAAESPVHISMGITGTSQGAALLAKTIHAQPRGAAIKRVFPGEAAELAAYANRWRKACQSVT